jgi:hypothetical protein
MYLRYLSGCIWLFGVAAMASCSAADESASHDETQNLSQVTPKERARDLLSRKERATDPLGELGEYEAAPEVQTRAGNVGLPRGAVTSDHPCEDEGDCVTWDTPRCYRNIEYCYKGLCAMKKMTGCIP